ncbi:MAG: adenylate/guanylate cyclase domain-containing protein [Planctomycetes bacterium]|nr:adenylate/guanylate cyclase domain-containing protein [Planctomycetota bacterium]
MSLRYKALIAVVLLVAVLTGALVVTSGQRFEEDARARITSDLRKDAGFLNTQVRAASRISRTALEGSAESSELVQLLTNPDIATLGDNLLTFARYWREDSESDIALAALDAFVADDKGAKMIAPAGKDLSIVAVSARDQFSGADRLLADPELIAFVDGFYHEYLDLKEGKVDQYSQAAVLPVAGAVFLVVQTYLFESIQDRSVVGIGVTLTEISSRWIRGNLPSAGEEDANPVHKLVFSGEVLTASTLGEIGSASSQAVFKRALSMESTTAGAQFEVEIEGETLMGLTLSSDLGPTGLQNRPGFITVKSLDKEFASFIVVRRGLFIFAAVLGLVAAAVAYFGAYTVIRRLRRIEEATMRVREGRFDTQVRVRGRDELSKLGKAFNDMTTGLKALGLYTHETLARSVLDKPELLGQASTREEGSIFFSDIKGFTTIAEGMGAEAVTAQLNEYFGELGKSLRDERGYVDKFIGDAIMAFWGPPFVKSGDYAVRACSAALACLAACAELRVKWARDGKPLFFQRIGIATGEVVVGNIGTETKKNFTVIGDNVNLASRLEGANKMYGTEILVDQRTAELAKGKVLFREIDRIIVVGKHEPVRIYQPIALLETGTQAFRGQLVLYEKALDRYRGREFVAAVETLNELLAQQPDDGAAKWLLGRCQELIAHPPGDDWQGVTTATSK